MKTISTDMQERAQQLWRELSGLDWYSHEQAIVGIIRDALEQAREDENEHISSEDLVKCGCDEYPECTHVLYWHQGFKAGMSRECEREQFETVLGQADYNPSCTKLHYVFHPDSKFQIGERVRVVIEKLTSP